MDLWSRRGGWLALTLFLAACASVLGIEDRQLDSADNYPVEGYDGCRPGAGCEGCLDVHKDECQVRNSCANSTPADGCVGCVCENCLEPVVACQLDAGCSVIWQCLRQSRCELSERASNSCFDECADEIRSHGGVNGAAFRAAAGIRDCAVTSQCLSCLAPQPEPSPACNRDNGCQDCGGCLQQCICSGDSFIACKESCGQDAPAESCKPEAACIGCANCFETCACGGGDFDECNLACQAEPLPPPATCTPQLGCDCNDDCVATCVCSGSEPSLCEAECAPPAPGDVCTQDNQGSESETCGGCNTCLGDCTCRGTALEICMEDCRLSACCNTNECNADLTYCMCAGDGAGGSTESADACAGSSWCDDAGSCDSCVCENCPGTYALCQQTYGCTDFFECMRATNCQGSQCEERCSGVNAGAPVAGEAFAVAESLWACHQGNQCTCTSTPPATHTCVGTSGAVDCPSYVGNDIVIEACCPEPPIGETTKAGGSGTLADASCGLQMQRYLPGAQFCEPMAQPREPALVLGCPDGAFAGPPYNGATLEGCCNEADSTCGYYDNVTGLGCVRASAFGVTEIQSCGIQLPI